VLGAGPPNFRKPLHRDHALQTAGSRSGNKVDIPTRIHIGIATGSVNKMTGNNAAQMEKIAARTITGINNTNKNKTSTNRSFR
jgi:hypothetical protein